VRLLQVRLPPERLPAVRLLQVRLRQERLPAVRLLQVRLRQERLPAVRLLQVRLRQERLPAVCLLQVRLRQERLPAMRLPSMRLSLGHPPRPVSAGAPASLSLRHWTRAPSPPSRRGRPTTWWCGCRRPLGAVARPCPSLRNVVVAAVVPVAPSNVVLRQRGPPQPASVSGRCRRGRLQRR